MSDDDASVLDEDGEKTPVDEDADKVACTEEDCDWTGEATELGFHRWIKHGLRSTKRGKSGAGKTGSSRARTAPRNVSRETTGGAKKPPPKKPSKKPPIATGTLEARLNASMGIVGVGVGMLDRYDGQVIVNGAPHMAKALADWHKADPKVRPYIEMLAFDTPWFPVVMVLLSMAFPIAHHHNLIKRPPPLPFRLFEPGDIPARPPAEGEQPSSNGHAPDLGAILAQAAADPNFAAFAQGMFGGSGFSPPMAGEGAESPAEPMGEPAA